MTRRSHHPRLSRLWASEQSDAALHGVAGKLRKLSQTQDLSKGQEWLWTVVVDELSYRRQLRLPGHRCECDLCFGPFDALKCAWELDLEGPSDPIGWNEL